MLWRGKVPRVFATSEKAESVIPHVFAVVSAGLHSFVTFGNDVDC